MEEQLITFETAKLAKEKGFDIPTYNAYIGNKFFENEHTPNGYDGYDIASKENWNKKEWVFSQDGECCFGCKLDNITYFEACSVSTQSLLQKWLREKQGIHIVLIPTVNSNWTYKTTTVLSERDDEIIIGIKDVGDLPPYKDVCGEDFSTYEKALESGLQEALKLIP